MIYCELLKKYHMSLIVDSKGTVLEMDVFKGECEYNDGILENIWI